MFETHVTCLLYATPLNLCVNITPRLRYITECVYEVTFNYGILHIYKCIYFYLESFHS